MEYLDNLITRKAYKCIGTSPGGSTVEGAITADSMEVTADSTVITADETI